LAEQQLLLLGLFCSACNLLVCLRLHEAARLLRSCSSCRKLTAGQPCHITTTATTHIKGVQHLAATWLLLLLLQQCSLNCVYAGS
jgi:hypothetical protein